MIDEAAAMRAWLDTHGLAEAELLHHLPNQTPDGRELTASERRLLSALLEARRMVVPGYRPAPGPAATHPGPARRGRAAGPVQPRLHLATRAGNGRAGGPSRPATGVAAGPAPHPARVSPATRPPRPGGARAMSTEALDWYEQAACRDLDPDRFDYDPQVDPPAKAEAAKGVCAGCQVRDACLDFALERPAAEDTTRVYGGLTPAERLARRSGAPSSRRLVADLRFAAVALELARQVGVQRAADQLGVRGRTLRRAWRRHGHPSLPSTPPPRPFRADELGAQARRQLGWSTPARLFPSRDPSFATDTFEPAARFGVARAAALLGVAESTLYRAWTRHQLGRPTIPADATRRFVADRALVERAFQLAQERSILAAASQFQTSPVTLRRAFARHGLSHPHAGLDRRELQRRWNTQPGPDHRNRAERRAARTRLAAQRRASGQAPASNDRRPDRQPPTRDRAQRSRPPRPEERER
jgi:WhiB family transcriptional regulator, redox-sensing transcriptional regulator